MSNLITGGVISIEDGDKTANKADQYDVSRKVRVELNFVVPEGQDGATVASRVGDLANVELARLLSGASPVTIAAATATQATAPKGKGKGAATKPPAEAPKTETPAAAPAAPATDPTSIDFDTPETPAADPAGIDFDVELPAEEVKEISDADLNAAAQKKAGEGIDPTEIRKVIAGFNPDPSKVFQLRQIPQAQRQDFLDQLSALTKA